MSGKYTIVQDDLCRIVGADAAVLLGKVAAFCGEENKPAEISFAYLMELLGGRSADTLQRTIKKLVTLGYLIYTPRFGKGQSPLFQKGVNLRPLEHRKGGKFAAQKGVNLRPKEYNNNIGREDAPACASTSPIDPPKKKKKGYAGDTPATPKKGGNMDIQLFWDAFKASPEYDSEREATERLWFGLPEEWQACIVEGCRCGDRYRLEKKNGRYINGNPYWYLHDYKPEKERRWSRSQLYTRYGTDAVPGWSIIEQRDRDGYIQFMRTRAAKLAGIKIEREFV